MRTSFFLAAALMIAAPAAAQVRPHPGSGDPHLQTVDYDPGQIVRLEAAPGYQLTVELSPDEQVQNVALGDSGAWQVNVNHRGDHLFLKPLSGTAATNMTVITSVRVYNFELYPLGGASADMPYTVTFRYPQAARSGTVDQELAPVSAMLRDRSRYKIGGDRMLRPDSVTDDGAHTYISWSRDKPIPAVYAVDDAGQEALVNGSMREGDVFVIDSICRKLSFRIDRRTAYAERLDRKKKS